MHPDPLKRILRLFHFTKSTTRGAAFRNRLTGAAGYLRPPTVSDP